MCYEITLDIENLCGLDQWGDSRRGEMGNLKFLSNSQISYQRPGEKVKFKLAEKEIIGPMVACDNNCTSTSLFTFLDEINFVKAFPLIRSFQLLSKVIITDASCKDNRLWR